MDSTAAESERFEGAPHRYRWADQDKPLTERIREQPLMALGFAAAAGFVAGGGLWSRTGRIVLSLVGRATIRRLVVDTIAKSVMNHGSDRRSGPY